MHRFVVINSFTTTEPENREIKSTSSSTLVMCIDQKENDANSTYSSVSEFNDNNTKASVTGELIADLCSAKNKATAIVTKFSGCFSIDLMQLSSISDQNSK